MSESGIPILSRFLTQGMHRDFTIRWYKDVGKIIMQAMVYQIYWTFVDFVLWFSYRTVLRIWDKRWWCCKKSKNGTRSRTVIDYVEIYAGPEYSIHYKYSTIINTLWITFMFGAGMPLLFPIALCQFVVIYIWERVLLTYSYRRPVAMLDEKLNLFAIKLMLIAPIFYSMIGYWMYDNEQLMGNYKLIPTSTYGESLRTGHSIWSSIAVPSIQSLMFIPAFLVLLITSLMQPWIIDTLKKKAGIQDCREKMEDITFYDALTTPQIDTLLKNDDQFSRTFNNSYLSPRVRQILETKRASRAEEKYDSGTLFGLPSYSLLLNRRYQKSLMYIEDDPRLEEHTEFIRKTIYKVY